MPNTFKETEMPQCVQTSVNCCFVASQKRDYDLPSFLNKGNTIYFPETEMTTNELLHTGRPNGFNIVTDSHFLVGLYDCDEVYYYDGKLKEWINPDFQTLGTSYNIILHKLWKYKNTIPKAILDGEITNIMGNPFK